MLTLVLVIFLATKLFIYCFVNCLSLLVTALSLLKAILSPIKIAVKNKNEDIFNRLIESGAGIP